MNEPTNTPAIITGPLVPRMADTTQCASIHGQPLSREMIAIIEAQVAGSPTNIPIVGSITVTDSPILGRYFSLPAEPIQGRIQMDQMDRGGYVPCLPASPEFKALLRLEFLRQREQQGS